MMSAYVTVSKYCIVQKGYENVNLGFLIQAWKSDFQTSELIRITRDWLLKSHDFLYPTYGILMNGA